ncbi:MAG: histidine phosphatase family protein [Fusobacteriaceae bacterium]
MITISFVRHGQTQWNEEGRFQGSKNSDLTKVGIDQGKKLNESFKRKNINFTKVYSSPLDRAFQTAKIITGDNYVIDTIEEFREINLGSMEGATYTEFEQQHPKEFFDFFNAPENYEPSKISGETFTELFNRVESGLKKLVDLHKSGDEILVVTHGITLKAICSYVINGKAQLQNFSKDPIPGNTSVTKVVYENKEFRIEDFSNTDHL